MLCENQETEDDEDVADKLVAQRNLIMQTQTAKDAGKASNKASLNGSIVGEDGQEEPPSIVVDEPKAKGKRAAPSTAPATSSKAKGKRAAAAPTKEKKPVAAKGKQKEREPVSVLPDPDDEDDLLDAFVKREWSSWQVLLRVLNKFL